MTTQSGVSVAVCLVCCAMFAGPLDAAGLRTTFSEVTVDGLEPGTTYSMKETAHLPLEVVNTGDEPVDLIIELVMPGIEELKEGYEAIPDLSWIGVEVTKFQGIPPGGSAIADIMVTVPDEDQFRGRKFQAFIWTHSIGTRVGVGLKSKLLFSVAEKDES